MMESLYLRSEFVWKCFLGTIKSLMYAAMFTRVSHMPRILQGGSNSYAYGNHHYEESIINVDRADTAKPSSDVFPQWKCGQTARLACSTTMDAGTYELQMAKMSPSPWVATLRLMIFIILKL